MNKSAEEDGCKYLEPERANDGLHSLKHKTGHVQHPVVTDYLVQVCPLILITILLFPAQLCLAASMPGESNPGIFYTATHLHPAAYLILFLIFLLSVVNLVFQGFLSFSAWPLSSMMGLLSFVSRKKKKKRGRQESSDSVGRPFDDSVMAVRKIGRTLAKETRVGIPTPLEGMNHPMPPFSHASGAATGLPRMVDSEDEKKPVAQEFKFASAVDIPSPEEVERREKEQLVVSGMVKGPDGKGIESVIVYLTDLDGTRVGQSCRSMSDTGEFRGTHERAGKIYTQRL